jgi:hypothetical protein
MTWAAVRCGGRPGLDDDCRLSRAGGGAHVRITRHALTLCGAGRAPASWRRGRPSGRGRSSAAVGKADKSDDWTDRQVDDGSSFLTLPGEHVSRPTRTRTRWCTRTH